MKKIYKELRLLIIIILFICLILMVYLALTMKINTSASSTSQSKLWRICWRIAKGAHYSDSRIQHRKKVQIKSTAKVNCIMEKSSNFNSKPKTLNPKPSPENLYWKQAQQHHWMLYFT